MSQRFSLEDIRKWQFWKRFQSGQSDDKEQELNLEFGLIQTAMIYIKNITSSPGSTKL